MSPMALLLRAPSYPVAANVLVVGAGLAVLMLSANPTIAQLGILIVMSLAASGYTSLVVFGLSQRGDARRLDEPFSC